MIPLTFIISPLVGAAIGWITNDLAIKMIFRPLEPKYIGKWKLPFTPGLIPKEKKRIAHAIGQTANTLVNTDTMRKNLLSTEMMTKIEQAADNFILKQRQNHENLQDFLSNLVSPNTLNNLINNGKDTISKVVKDKLNDSIFSQQIADNIVKNVIENSKGLIAGIVSLFNLENSVKEVLGRKIHEVLQSNTETIVHQVVDNGAQQLLEMEMSTLFTNNAKCIENIKQQLINAYRKGVEGLLLSNIMSNINIAKMVEDKINEMDIAEVEEMLLSIIKKELRAIVWLGAILGFFMGFATAVINMLIG